MADLADYPLLASGKVRDLYRVDDAHLLMVASDRISAYDFVLSPGVPDKGRVLTAMSVFWFDLLGDVVPNHLVSVDDPRIPADVLGRAMLVHRLSMVPVECVARGFLAGSGLAEYRSQGTVCGIMLPDGLTDSSRLEQPIFTPATKAEQGQHDENMSYRQLADGVGGELAARLREATLAVYDAARDHAATRGILLADTKLEFGFDDAGALVLGDEVLTPDSSRFWPAVDYQPGHPQPSFDKQYVRDWLTGPSGWDRAGDTPPPELPADVIAATRQRYIDAYEQLSGRSFADWPG